MLINKDLILIKRLIKKAQTRFPKFFNLNLMKDFFRLLANKNESFLSERTIPHLFKILLTQFFLQKKFEISLMNKQEKLVSTKIFKTSNRICIAIILSFDRYSEIFNEKDILKILQDNVAGTIEVSNSFYTFQSIDLGYMFCYLEVKKIRGNNLDISDIKQLQNTIKKQILHDVKSFCPAIFWPYHFEDAFRQLNTLVNELQDENDIPQVSVNFKGQTAVFLEFIFYMAYPKKLLILKKLSNSLPSFIHFSLHTDFTNKNHPFAKSLVFSLHYPVEKTIKPINLLSVRKSITVLLEDIIGPYRDFNGGLFIKQEDVFEKIKQSYGNIEGFNFFASKLFYSLKPVEIQLTLKIELAKVLFKTFAKVMQNQKNPYFQQASKVIIFKNKKEDLLKHIVKQIKGHTICYAILEINNTYYLAVIASSEKIIQKIKNLISTPLIKSESKKTLRLVFNEGAPPSLNPCYVYSDIRCCTIYRALFEGLTRTGPNEKITLAGAESYEVSSDNMHYLFKLKDNRWSNGEKVTAYHYEKRWKENITSAKEFLVNDFFVLKNGKQILKEKCSKEKLGVKAIDENTLAVDLAYKDNRFLNKLSLPLFYPSYNQNKEPTIFNGPFIINDFNSKYLKLEKSPYFWDNRNIKIDFIDIKFLSDSNLIFKLFEEGKIDWIGAPLATISIQLEKKLNKILKERRAPLSFWLYINPCLGHLRSKYIRKALSLSIDRKKIYQEIHLRALLEYPFSQEAKLKSIEFNPSKAKELFEIGLKRIKINLESFHKIELSYFTYPKMKELAHYIAKTWEDILNIKVNLVEHSWNNFRNSLEQGSFQIGGCFEKSDFPSFYNIIENFNYIDSKFSSNSSFMKNLNYYQESGKEKFLTNALDIFVEDLPAIPLYDSMQKYASINKLSDYIFDETGGVDFSRAYFK